MRFFRRNLANPDQLYQETYARLERELREAGMSEEGVRNAASGGADATVRHALRRQLLTEEGTSSLRLPWDRPGYGMPIVTGHIVRSKRVAPPISCPVCGRRVALFLMGRDEPEWLTDDHTDLAADPSRGRFFVERRLDGEIKLHPCTVPEEAPAGLWDARG